MVNIQNNMPAANNPIPMDPLLIAIKSYTDGRAAYEALDEDLQDGQDDLSAALIDGPNEVLTNWASPATSHEAALAAIVLAKRESEVGGDSPIIASMCAAALGYWANVGRSKSKPQAGAEPAPRIGLNELSADTLMMAPEAAAYLSISEVTLARWRSTKRGPLFIKAGGRVLYRVSALLDYVAKNERKGTRPDN